MRGLLGVIMGVGLSMAACESDEIGSHHDAGSAVCGNGVIEGAEDCDQLALGGVHCDDLVPGSAGTLLCSAQCTFDITGCGGEVCGNGVIEGVEDCDLSDLGGATCADVIPGTAGTLLCSAQCTYDVSGCAMGPVCGNGIREFGEPCDCGTDPMFLPLGCTDVNGGANANCSSNCTVIDLCGDGIQTGQEECDCGDPSMITQPPPGCATYNGDPSGTCGNDCLLP